MKGKRPFFLAICLRVSKVGHEETTQEEETVDSKVTISNGLKAKSRYIILQYYTVINNACNSKVGMANDDPKHTKNSKSIQTSDRRWRLISS